MVDAEPILPAALINASKVQNYNTERNRLTQATLAGSPVAFTYDDEGQLLSKGGTAFTFDSANRLTGFGANSYQYDGVGNRLVATRDGITTQYVYDAAGNLLAETDGTGTITRYYIHGLGLLAMVDAQTDEVYVYHHDGTGHTVAMTDASASIVNRYAYSPYGEVLGKDEQVEQPFTYVGQYGVMTEPDGLYYMRARYYYYDAEVGRFISEDPIGFDGGVNLYSYAGGNPVAYIDPNGDVPLLVILPAVGGLISGGFNAVNAAIDGQSAGGVAAAFGRGFAGGAGGTFVGISAGVATGNPFIAGAAGGLVGDLIGQGLSGGSVDPVSAAISTASGAIGGPLAARILPTRGFLPSLARSRTRSNFGPNSVRLTGQEAISSTFGGVVGSIPVPGGGK